MHKEKNIFKYKYEEKIAYVLDILQKAGIDYIEISPIVPQNSEIWFEKKVVLKNKLYSMDRKNKCHIDLNSTNGTFRNGMRLEPNASEIIEPGDEIRLGKLKFIYR